MEHTDKYLKTEEMMQSVIGCVEQYSESRFIASLYTRSYTKIDIQIAISDVRSCLMLVHGELLRLSKYSLEFLDQWATRDNQRFTSSTIFAISGVAFPSLTAIVITSIIIDSASL